ncbi:MAG: hypothetical protein HPY51_21005 [Candidatus Omnitrophica bacterium]|nr:hypothetical protein [Candidatus Omnitrophota bacterium]
MKDPALAKEQDIRREAYLLASRNPWLLWRLKILESGYLPPLVPGEVPPELLQITHQIQASREYHAKPLLDHAKEMRVREKQYFTKIFTILMLTVTLIFGLSFLLALKQTHKFRIGVIEALLPRAEVHTSLSTTEELVPHQGE